MTVAAELSGVDRPGALEVLWSRLIAIADDQATVLKQTSFTYIVRDSDDLSAAVFDARGRMVVQAVTGSPGHINSLAAAVPHLIEAFPELIPGDVLITNEPWLNSGQLNDFTVVTPVFGAGGEAVGFVGSTCHALDVGGRGLGAAALDVFEEGLRILPAKLYKGGEPDESLISMIRWNVRVPALTLGDIHAQVVSNEAAAMNVAALLEEFDLPDLTWLSDEVSTRSEAQLREAIAELPDGAYEASLSLDGVDEPIVLACRVEVRGDSLSVSYDGSSPQSRYGINVVLSYATAYTTYAINCALAPGVPHNDGSFRPIDVEAPLGSILNARFPAPVAARHTVGHFVPSLVIEALAKADPEVAMAHGSSSLWVTTVRGIDEAEEPFVSVMFASGGMGARPHHDGLSTISFPSGAATTPVEVLEATSPIVIEEKSLRPDSGGPGRFRGGMGQRIVMSVRSGRPWMVSCLCNRLQHPADGIVDGLPGATGRVALSTGSLEDPKIPVEMPADGRIVLELPGGGGFGRPRERDASALTGDRAAGLVTTWPGKD